METEAIQDQQLWNKNYKLIILATFFSTIPFFMLLTIFPVYAVEILGGNEQAAGLLNTTFLLGAIIARPVSGKLADDLDLKKMIISGLILQLLSTVLYLTTLNLSLLLVFRFFNGVFVGNASTAVMSAAAHSIPYSRQGEGIGYVSTVANLGTVIGPFVGLSLARHSLFTLIFIIACLSILFSLLISFFVNLPHLENKEKERQPISISQLIEKNTVPIALFMCLMGMLYAGVLSFISVYAMELNLLTAASYFFLIYAVASLFTRIIIGRIYDIYGINVIAYPAIILFAIGMFMLSQSQTTFLMLLSGVFIGAGYGSLIPTFQTVAIQQAPPDRKGAATATYYALLDGGVSLGSFLLGTVILYIGYANLYLSTSMVLLASLILYYWIYARKISGQAAALSQNHKLPE